MATPDAPGTNAPEAKRVRAADDDAAPVMMEIGTRLLITVGWSRHLAESFGFYEIPSRWVVTKIGVPLPPDEWGDPIFRGIEQPDRLCVLQHRCAAGIVRGEASFRAGEMVTFCFDVDRHKHGVGVVLRDGKWRMTFGQVSTVEVMGKNLLEDLDVSVDSW